MLKIWDLFGGFRFFSYLCIKKNNKNMTKISMFKKDNGALLVIWETRNGNLVGEVFNDGVEKRGKWDMRATFYVADGDATEFRVCEYFNFPYPNAYWKRWA